MESRCLKSCVSTNYSERPESALKDVVCFKDEPDAMLPTLNFEAQFTHVKTRQP